MTDSLDSVPMRFPRAATAALFPAALAACTTNPFLAGYSGERFPAVTAATVAALTVVDMGKSVDRSMVIEGVRVLEKRGGLSGDYVASLRSAEGHAP